MDGRLAGLDLTASRRYRCLDATLETIGRYCPNLTNFRYGFRWDWQEDNFEETVTEKGIVALLRACPKLRVCVCGTVLSSSCYYTSSNLRLAYNSRAPVVFRIWN
jgi:hypothetical protein